MAAIATSPPKPTMAEVLVASLALAPEMQRRRSSTVATADASERYSVGLLTPSELGPPAATALLMRGIQPVATLTFASMRTPNGVNLGVAMNYSVDPRVLARHGPSMLLTVRRSPLRAQQCHTVTQSEGSILLVGARLEVLEGTEVVLKTLGDESGGSESDEEDGPFSPEWRSYGFITGF
jgi:hypothetical protein